MKKTFIILSLIGLIGCEKNRLLPFRTIPIIIMSGESNVGGRGENDSLTTYELAPRKSLKILNNSNLLFENLDIGVNNLIGHQGLVDNATHGIENGLANCADSGVFYRKPIYFIKAGSGSARIKWYNDSTFLYQKVNAWQQLKTRLDSAIKLVKKINYNRTPPIILVWQLGGNDANQHMDSYAWKDSNKVFLAKFRARYGGVGTPIFITYLANVFPEYNARITEIINEVPNCYGIATGDAKTISTDKYHWNFKGFKLVATRIAHSIITNTTFY